jgi:uncharacterized protein YcbX
MAIVLGRIEALHRYPVKSMRGEPLEVASMGWHGLEGDRRLALRRVDDHSGFPWLTAGKLHELVHWRPAQGGGSDGDGPPTHVTSPEGRAFDVFGDALTAEIGRRHGAPVQMLRIDRGIFDDFPISVITSATVAEVARLAGVGADARRFRPNIVVASQDVAPFGEGEWLGGVLTFGDADDAPAVAVTRRDVRCVMVNLEPDGGAPCHEVLKVVARANQTVAGVYGTVTRTGRLAVGQTVTLHR